MSDVLIRRCGVLVAAALFLAAGASDAWVWNPATGRWINEKNLPQPTAQLQVEAARSLMEQGEYKRAIRETNKFDKYYLDSEWADDNQFLRGEINMRQGDYLDAANEFQQVITNYPDTDLYDTVIKKQYEIGDKFYALGEKRMGKRWTLFRSRPFKKAIQIYSMVIDNQPFQEAAAEAQYKVGLCHFTRDEYVEAAYEYQRVLEDYAGSDWVDDASYGLAMCYYEASLSPAYDQTRSRLAIEAIDEFKSRFPEDERTQGLDEKREEMREKIARQRLLTARFYEKRRRFDAARIYYEAVVEQFPDTAAATDAKDWLDKTVQGEPAAQQ
ncbi:MAG TPA: outer membrane protein assembly factor BamD [Candidatus Hydrogenedentes bacterium]|nr:outer membrane protein assembly factor BamD [Candidatus Hydrogenedentota bacterium]HQE81354.1 outer membrane protein assembly factor BamD [Candidatus Hydrogenedentota bacterium]HQH50949.1 outer membrane protein assembly factor BamD [Candidatus Hydrogenedentota bacterium]HQM47039.1 outer membrane protein assembly factor BamD [Candidatus Hydrogenedentota bacterium]